MFYTENKTSVDKWREHGKLKIKTPSKNIFSHADK